MADFTIDNVNEQLQAMKQEHGGDKFILFVDPLDLVYDKNNLSILLGDTQEKCIRYGDGYSWCICREVGNMFNCYRSGEGEPTFYFVYDRDKPETDPNHHIVIHKNIDGTYAFTDAVNEGDPKVSWKYIISRQPKLKGLEHMFQHKPLTDDERALYNRFEDEGLGKDEFLALSFEEKELYVSLAKLLDEETLLSLFGTRSNKIIVNQYITINFTFPFSVYKKLTRGQQRKVYEQQIAAVKDDIQVLQALLKAGYEPGEEYPNELIMTALKTEGDDAIEILIKEGYKLGEEITEPMIMTALESSGYAIEHLIEAEYEMSDEMIMTALRSNGYAIRYLIEAEYKITKPMIMTALENDGHAIELLIKEGYKLGEEITEPMIMTALENDGDAIRYLIEAEYEMTEPMTMTALKSNGYAIRYLESRTF